MKFRIRSIIVAALLFGAHALQAAIFTYNNGDVLLVLRQPGQPNLEVDLGPVSQFVSASPGSQTTITSFDLTQLQAAYSSVAALNWAVISDIRQTSVYGLPVNTLFLTNPRTDINAQATPLTEASTFQQGAVGSLIATIAGFGSTEGAVVWSSGEPANAISNTADVVIIPESDPSSYTSIAGTAGTLAGNFTQGDIENLTPSPFTSGATRSDLYELEPGSSPGTYLGYFEFDANGTVTFTAAGGSSGSDLAVSIPSAGAVGSNITYTVAVQNNGPATATNVVVTDTLPGGVNFISAVPSLGTTTQSLGVVTWNLDVLSNGASATTVIEVSALSIGQFTDAISVNYPGDPVPSNNNASATVTVSGGGSTNLSDLAVTKVANASSVTIGSNITYTVTVVNNGPAIATNVVVGDTLPSGVGFVSAVANQGTATQAGGVVTWNVGNLNDGASASELIVVSTISTGLIANTASVNYPGDPVPSNNTSTASVTVVNSSTVSSLSDLAVTKVANASSVTIGSNITYTVTVVNNGPATATNVVVGDTLPNGVSFISAVGGQGTATQAGGVVTWNVGNLNDGASASESIIVSAVSTGLISNTASVNYPGDPVPSNNTSAVLVTVVNSGTASNFSDLTVTKVANVSSVTVGGNITYTVTVVNNGPATATNVVVGDALPNGVSFISAVGGQGTATQAGGVVTWNVGNLIDGASATGTIIVSTVSTGLIVNTASVNYPGDNNSATASVTVNSAASTTGPHDLSIISITGPGFITLSPRRPSVTKSVSVEIVNAGTNSVTIADFSGLITLVAKSTGTNASARVVLHSGSSQRKLPVTLKPKRRLAVLFDVTFDESDEGTLSYSATLSSTDAYNTADEVCPRPATFSDPGCGGLNFNGTRGAPLLVKVVVKK
jgi:large repetitive protein